MRGRVIAASVVTALAVLVASVSGPLFAWSAESQVEIAWEAARLAPPDLYRQIVRHRHRYRAGVLEPFRDGEPLRHEKNPDGTGWLDAAVALEAGRAVTWIRSHRPFADVVHQLGVVVHLVNDANYPLHTSAADSSEPGYAEDYGRYVRSAQRRFAAAFYGVDPRLDSLGAVRPFIQRSLDRARALYPYVGSEYRRVEGQSGLVAFDDRSTAFGVAAVSFSRALTDAAAMLRLIWLEAGGADPVPRLRLSAKRIQKLPPLR